MSSIKKSNFRRFFTITYCSKNPRWRPRCTSVTVEIKYIEKNFPVTLSIMLWTVLPSGFVKIWLKESYHFFIFLVKLWIWTMLILMPLFSGAHEAPWVSKFVNPLSEKFWFWRQRTSVHPSVRPSVRPYRLWGRVRGVPRQPDRGRRIALFFWCSWSKQYGGWFLVHSIFNTIIVIHSWNEDL